jgi:hypothetical protein
VAKAMPVSVRDASVFAGDMGASNQAEETTGAEFQPTFVTEACNKADSRLEVSSKL